MSIKSTVRLTRGEAWEMYHSLLVEIGAAVAISDKQLGYVLDALREQQCERAGEPCLTNYLVIPEGER